MTLIGGDADHRIAAHAAAVLAGVDPGAGIVVVARGVVGCRRIGAQTRPRIARAGHVTLIGGRADDRIRTDACACLSAIALRTGVAVSTRAAIRLCRVGAQTRARIARASHVTLIEGGADNGIAANAAAALAAVGLRTGVAVSARAAVRLCRIGAQTRTGIARAGHVTLIGCRADDRIRTDACACLAAIALRTGVAIIA